jgi:hypothetical protein
MTACPAFPVLQVPAQVLKRLAVQRPLQLRRLTERRQFSIWDARDVDSYVRAKIDHQPVGHPASPRAPLPTLELFVIIQLQEAPRRFPIVPPDGGEIRAQRRQPRTAAHHIA